MWHHRTSHPRTSHRGSIVSSSFHLEMLEIVTGLDPLCAAERRVVEVRPRARDAAIIEGDGRLGAHVEAGVGFARTKALDLVQYGQHGVRVEHAIHLAPDA